MRYGRSAAPHIHRGGSRGPYATVCLRSWSAHPGWPTATRLSQKWPPPFPAFPPGDATLRQQRAPRLSPRPRDRDEPLRSWLQPETRLHWYLLLPCVLAPLLWPGVQSPAQLLLTRFNLIG